MKCERMGRSAWVVSVSPSDGLRRDEGCRVCAPVDLVQSRKDEGGGREGETRRDDGRYQLVLSLRSKISLVGQVESLEPCAACAGLEPVPHDLVRGRSSSRSPFSTGPVDDTIVSHCKRMVHYNPRELLSVPPSAAHSFSSTRWILARSPSTRTASTSTVLPAPRATSSIASSSSIISKDPAPSVDEATEAGEEGFSDGRGDVGRSGVVGRPEWLVMKAAIVVK
jgi:hypothetical protein